jgi:hypothetical protein
VLTKHEDIRLVNRNPAIFSNARGIFLNDVKYQQVAQADGPTITDSFFPPGGEQIGIWCGTGAMSWRSLAVT